MTQYAAPLTVKLKKSSRFFVYLVSIHLAGFICLWLIDMPMAPTVIGSVTLFVSLSYYLMRDIFFRLPHSVTQIEWDKSDRWFLYLNDQTRLRAELSEDSFRFSWFIALKFKSDDAKKRAVILFRDSTDKHSFRLLKVRLKVNRRLNQEDATVVE